MSPDDSEYSEQPRPETATSFLYPFLDRSERDAPALLDDLAQSAAAKAELSRELFEATAEVCRAVLEEAAAEMARRFSAGGRLFTFGNGGSATDASGMAQLFADPPVGQPLPARSLALDYSVLTALGNDVGYELVFSRQLIAAASGGDIAVGLSTSGNSDNVIAAFGEAQRRGMLTIGLAGYEGGAMAASDHVGNCLVVRSDSVHRIQEAQAALIFELWTRVQRELGEQAA